MTNKSNIQHPIPPLFDANSRVLVLGSFPSPASRTQGFFYGHPQNRFWPMLAQLFDEPAPTTIERKRDMALRHHIALWDSLASCTIEGASDASITNALPNDFSEIMRTARIGSVFCNGATSAKYYTRYCQATTGIPCTQMPSTSPANAAWNMQRLLEKWVVLKEASSPYLPPTLAVDKVVGLEHTLAAAGTSLHELMDRAGTHLAYHAHALCSAGCAVVLCGNGNNGGDGWVAARQLLAYGHTVTLISAKHPRELSAQPAAQTACALLPELRQAGAKVLVAPSTEEVQRALANADLIIDALLGTGFVHSAVREPFASWIKLANQCHAAGACVVAADVPSGVNANTGATASPSISADLTVTMIVPKAGLFTGVGTSHAGDVRVAPLAYIEPHCLT